jgi:hypothetical protein
MQQTAPNYIFHHDLQLCQVANTSVTFQRCLAHLVGVNVPAGQHEANGFFQPNLNGKNHMP